jgi:peptide/histidine transporter 3/4
LDRAAIVTPGDVSESGGRPNPWRLSTVHRVEELKSIARMLPIWSAGIVLATAGSHNGSFTIMQARTMERHITGSLEIPPATLSIFTTGTTLVSIILYDRVFVPVARCVTGRPSGVTYFQRMGIGLTIAVFGVGAAALVETRRRGVAADHGLLDTPKAVVPMSVFWLVPQYAVHGVADAFASVGQMEFLYDQAPESMRSTAVALFWLCGSLGSYLSTVLVTVVQRATRRHGDWLQDNINRGRIDNYYWLITFIMLLNLGHYLCCFYFYTLKPLEVQADDEHKERDDDLHPEQKNNGIMESVNIA